MNYFFARPDYRSLVTGVDEPIPVNGRLIPCINFDNAATTPPFKSVLEEINHFSTMYASVHRGAGYKSQFTSQFYENARKEVLSFVKGDYKHNTCIFVANTTAGINKLANRLAQEKDRRNVVLCTQMEHHSNDLPWRNKFHVDYIQTDYYGRLDLDDLEKKLRKYKGSVKLVTVTGASNVTGYINPIHKIAELTHYYQAKIAVDGAQLVPHAPINMKPNSSSQHIDYLVFSAHKMYAPFGTGVLIGPKSTFEQGEPDYVGGGTVNLVTHNKVIWNDPPAKEEAGTPNVMGVVALVAAIKTIKSIGIKNMERYEKSLLNYLWPKLKNIPGIELYSQPMNDSIGVIPFNLQGVPHSLLAYLLAQEGGIAVRNGCFCAQPYVQKLLKISAQQIKHYMNNLHLLRPGMVRVSFGIYNTFEEIDRFLHVLQEISQKKKHLRNKYEAVI